MISSDFNRLGLPPIRRLDEHTKFFICGSLIDRAGNVAITNHGLESDGRYIYAPSTAPSSYAQISGSGLGSEVIVSGSVPWTVEIAFDMPVQWSAITQDISCIFGYSDNVSRFDILLKKSTTSIILGGMIDGITGITSGMNLLVIQKDSSGVFDWRLNGTKTGSQVGQMSARGGKSLNILWNGASGDRYGYPFKIHYIRISNCLRLT